MLAESGHAGETHGRAGFPASGGRLGPTRSAIIGLAECDPPNLTSRSPESLSCDLTKSLWRWRRPPGGAPVIVALLAAAAQAGLSCCLVGCCWPRSPDFATLTLATLSLLLALPLLLHARCFTALHGASIAPATAHAAALAAPGVILVDASILVQAWLVSRSSAPLHLRAGAAAGLVAVAAVGHFLAKALADGTRDDAAAGTPRSLWALYTRVRAAKRAVPCASAAGMSVAFSSSSAAAAAAAAAAPAARVGRPTSLLRLCTVATLAAQFYVLAVVGWFEVGVVLTLAPPPTPLIDDGSDGRVAAPSALACYVISMLCLRHLIRTHLRRASTRN